MSNVLMIVAPDQYRDEEFEVPRDHLVATGHSVIVCSKDVRLAKGALGGSTRVDIDIEDVNPEDYDAVIFVGGSGAQIYFDDSTAHSLARKNFEAGNVTAAICIAPTILAHAGILAGKKTTAFSTEAKELEKAGAEYTGEPVEVDDTVVTANGPAAAKSFAEEIERLLN